MTTNPSAELLDNLLTATGRTTAAREEVRVSSMSGVERVTFPYGSTAIFKYAKKPFDSEDQALRLAHTLGVPVPQVHASAVREGWLGMLMEDLGPSVREADDLDGVAAAVVLHGTRTAPPLPVLGQERLRTLPAHALEHLERLGKADRWQDADAVEDALDRIAQAAEVRSAGATLAPAGEAAERITDNTLRLHLVPVLGSRAMTATRRNDLQVLFKNLSEQLGPGSVRNVYDVLVRAMAAAVEDKVIASSPCRRITLPPIPDEEITPPTVAQVEAMARVMPPDLRAAVVTLAGSGVRIGELLGWKTEWNCARRTLQAAEGEAAGREAASPSGCRTW